LGDELLQLRPFSSIFERFFSLFVSFQRKTQALTQEHGCILQSPFKGMFYDDFSLSIALLMLFGRSQYTWGRCLRKTKAPIWFDFCVFVHFLMM